MSKKHTFIIIFFIASVSICLNAEAIGRIIYIEGIVDIHRDGEIIELFDDDAGLEINEFDLIATAEDGIIEIELIKLANKGTIVKVDNNTAFYMDLGAAAGKKQTNIELLAGSIALKVKKLSSSEDLRVRSQGTVMGVRGTDFDVTISPDGSVLVTCEHGKVSCKDTSKNEIFAFPGSVVEKLANKKITSYNVDAGDEILFKQYWDKQRLEVFKSGAKTFIIGFVNQYQSNLPRFRNAYDSLIKKMPLLIKYGRPNGKNYSTGELMKVKIELSTDIMKMRTIFPFFEYYYFRLVSMKRFHDRGIGEGVIKRNYTTSQFFTEFRRDFIILRKKLAEVRYMFKLYMNISRKASGGLPENSLMDNVFSGGIFQFHFRFKRGFAGKCKSFILFNQHKPLELAYLHYMLLRMG